MTDLVVSGGITVNGDKTLNFGDFVAKEKVKVKDFNVNGYMYNVKTHNEVTRLEQNGQLLVECVPGASVWNFSVGEDAVSCVMKGTGITNLIFGLAPDTEYGFFVGGKKIGGQNSGISGKLSFSAELDDAGVEIRVARADG